MADITVRWCVCVCKRVSQVDTAIDSGIALLPVSSTKYPEQIICLLPPQLHSLLQVIRFKQGTLGLCLVIRVVKTCTDFFSVIGGYLKLESFFFHRLFGGHFGKWNAISFFLLFSSSSSFSLGTHKVSQKKNKGKTNLTRFLHSVKPKAVGFTRLRAHVRQAHWWALPEQGPM